MKYGLASCYFQFMDKRVHGGIPIPVTAGHFPVNEAQYVFNIISLSQSSACQQAQSGPSEYG